MRVVVIGGSGQVGTFLVPWLAELGEVEAEWTSKTSR
jgi:NADPH:quinone reductase-like Zn-dependent oxidoreductase